MINWAQPQKLSIHRPLQTMLLIKSLVYKCWWLVAFMATYVTYRWRQWPERAAADPDQSQPPSVRTVLLQAPSNQMYVNVQTPLRNGLVIYTNVGGDSAIAVKLYLDCSLESPQTDGMLTSSRHTHQWCRSRWWSWWSWRTPWAGCSSPSVRHHAASSAGAGRSLTIPGCQAAASVNHTQAHCPIRSTYVHM